MLNLKTGFQFHKAGNNCYLHLIYHAIRCVNDCQVVIVAYPLPLSAVEFLERCYECLSIEASFWLFLFWKMYLFFFQEMLVFVYVYFSISFCVFEIFFLVVSQYQMMKIHTHHTIRIRVHAWNHNCTTHNMCSNVPFRIVGYVLFSKINFASIHLLNMTCLMSMVFKRSYRYNSATDSQR